MSPYVLLGALALVVSACSSGSETAARKAAEASAYLEAGNLYAAKQAAFASVAARDDVSANWILLGRIQLAGGEIGDAFVSYSRALELDATNIEAMQLVADIALQVGRFRDADKTADQLLALQPGMVRAKLIKGFVALSEQKFDVAARYADEILNASPNDDGGVVLKARALAKQGQLAEATKMLETQALLSRSEIVATTLAEVQRASGDGPALAKSLTGLVAEKPTDDRIFDLAGVLYKIGRVQDARQLIFQHLEKREDRPDYYDEVTSFLITADPGAIDPARTAQIAQSGTARMRELAARILLASNRAPDARRVLEPIFPTTVDTDIKALYAVSLAATGAASRTPPIVADVLKADESNTDALQLRAELKLAGGDDRGALADAALVARNNPLSIGSRMTTIGIYLKRGDRRRARQLFEEAIRAMPKSLEMAERYLVFLSGEHDRARALEIMTSYTDLNPSRVRGWEVLNSVCGDEECRTRAAAGKAKAAKLFPADEFAGKKPSPGLFGPL